MPDVTVGLIIFAVFSVALAIGANYLFSDKKK